MRQSTATCSWPCSTRPAHDPGTILHEARRLRRGSTTDPLAGHVRARPVRLPGRRLRIGYVSADFREHPSSISWSRSWPPTTTSMFEIYCYADVLAT